MSSRLNRLAALARRGGVALLLGVIRFAIAKGGSTRADPQCQKNGFFLGNDLAIAKFGSYPAGVVSNILREIEWAAQIRLLEN